MLPAALQMSYICILDIPIFKVPRHYHCRYFSMIIFFSGASTFCSLDRQLLFFWDCARTTQILIFSSYFCEKQPGRAFEMANLPLSLNIRTCSTIINAPRTGKVPLPKAKITCFSWGDRESMKCPGECFPLSLGYKKWCSLAILNDFF